MIPGISLRAEIQENDCDDYGQSTKPDIMTQCKRNRLMYSRNCLGVPSRFMSALLLLLSNGGSELLK